MVKTSIVVGLLAAGVIAVPVAAKDREGTPPTAALLRKMTGAWDVAQEMYTGPRTPPIKLPSAVAIRTEAAGGGFIDETMTLAPGVSGDAFTRAAHINYNAVAKRFEYSSIDSRAPQQMSYRSSPQSADYVGGLHFDGSTFVAAQWGTQRNVPFHYRVELSPVDHDKQTLLLYLRPLAGGAEFVGFRYLYVRRH